MVRGGCYRDGKDSFDFVCSRGSNRRSLVLSGNMTPTTGLRSARQAIFCRRRHQPRMPPLAKIRPGTPAPTIGPGTLVITLPSAKTPSAPIPTEEALQKLFPGQISHIGVTGVLKN